MTRSTLLRRSELLRLAAFDVSRAVALFVLLSDSDS
jgi:hypothetical protein